MSLSYSVYNPYDNSAAERGHKGMIATPSMEGILSERVKGRGVGIWAKCLLCKLEVLSSNPKHACKRWDGNTAL